MKKLALPLLVLPLWLGLAAPVGAEQAALSSVPAGVAEAPEMVRRTPKPVQIIDAVMVEAPEVVAEPEVLVDQPGSPADDPGPNTDPSISAPQTTDPNGGGMTFAPEGTTGCYDTVHEYLDEWHNTGVQPQAPCFVVPDSAS